MADVYLNDVYVGTVPDAKQFADTLRVARRMGELPLGVNVFVDEDTGDVHISTTKGRLRRPLIVVKDGKPLLTEQHVQKLEQGELSWQDLVRQGIIEYLDAAEEENALVAFTPDELTPEHTHLEVSPFSMFSLSTSLLPYLNHSAAQKVNTGSKNQKQALGLYTANYARRIDSEVSILHYPQKPIVKTVMHDLSQYEKHPAGQQVVVAVMSYRGYNMEDAVIINRASIDRGFGRSTYFKPYVSEELRYSGGLSDQFGIPDKEVVGYRTEYDYRLLEEDGLISPEAEVQAGDVLIGKLSPPRFMSSMDQFSFGLEGKRESSTALKHGDKGIVDLVVLTENDEGHRVAKVRIRDTRPPELGDKFTSRHGQKGVLGLIVPEEDMPFTASGVKPDLIFSPHSIPSRMTINHLMEVIGGKTAALSGREVDATPFEGEPEEALRRELVRLGFREEGTETMYDGITGEAFEVRIFIGPMYYLKLKHMVANKIQARALGPIQLLTRQPTEGRAREGGLRLGEMEKEVFASHGAALVLKERFSSDRTIVPVCERCGMIAVYDEFKKHAYCTVCGEQGRVSFIEMSYAFKLLLDEFKSMGIYPKLRLTTKF